MARSLGPVLAAGAITMVNQSVFNGQPIDWRVPVGVGLAAGILALVEAGAPEVATGMAWLLLGTILITRVNPGVPSPAESALAWWRKGAGKEQEDK